MPNYSNQYTPHKKEQHRRHAKYFYNNQVRAYMSADSPNLIFTHNDGNGPSGSILDPGSILVSNLHLFLTPNLVIPFRSV